MAEPKHLQGVPRNLLIERVVKLEAELERVRQVARRATEQLQKVLLEDELARVRDSAP